MSDAAAPEPAVPPAAGDAAPPAVGRAAVPPPPAPPRPPGTVYRAAPHHEPVIDPPSEGTGSLTGFILSRGRADTGTPRWRFAVVVLVSMLMIAVIAVIGLVAVATLLDQLLGD